MLDREKIIKGMEQFRTDLKPFCGNHADWERFDAGLSMLKEQEAVQPVFDVKRDDVIGRFHCGACHSMIDSIHPLYCPHCGRKVKWE